MTTLNIRIEEKIKSKASKTLSALGLDMSTAVKLFLNQVVAEKALPFTPMVMTGPKARALRKKWDREVAYALKHRKSYKNAKEALADLW